MSHRDLLNELYAPLERKRGELLRMLQDCGLKAASGYYNGHYHKDTQGDYRMDYYPIPVISVWNLCDLEIDFDDICVSTKLTREEALAYDYGKLVPYPFEAFGVEDYLADFYLPGMSADALRRSILESSEQEIGFSFRFDFDAALPEFVKLLQSEGFYY